MKWIGLTGGIATGKSTVAGILRGYSEPVIDADEIVHILLQSKQLGYQRVIEHFDFVLEDGTLDRFELARCIFNDSKKREQLESILHPLVQEEVYRRKTSLEEKGVERAFYDVPLLFEKNIEKQFDDIVLVICSVDLQKQRMRERNQWSEKDIEARLKAQMPIEEKRKLANHVIENNGSLEDLKVQVKALLNRL